MSALSIANFCYHHNDKGDSDIEGLDHRTT